MNHRHLPFSFWCILFWNKNNKNMWRTVFVCFLLSLSLVFHIMDWMWRLCKNKRFCVCIPLIFFNFFFNVCWKYWYAVRYFFFTYHWWLYPCCAQSDQQSVSLKKISSYSVLALFVPSACQDVDIHDIFFFFFFLICWWTITHSEVVVKSAPPPTPFSSTILFLSLPFTLREWPSGLS